MKDKEARDDIDELWIEARALNLRTHELETARDSIQLYEMDCPECGRKTLMKRGDVRGFGDDALFNAIKAMYRPTFYCYTCGKTFKEVEKKELEVVQVD